MDLIDVPPLATQVSPGLSQGSEKKVPKLELRAAQSAIHRAPMKILVFTSLFPNNVWPNAGVFIKERMSHVAKVDGCHIKVMAPVPYYPPIKIGWRWGYSQVVHREQIDGLEVFHPRYFMIPKIGMAAYGWMMFLSVLPAVKRIQRKFDFDLIDAHWVYPDGFAAVLLGSVLRKRVVISARGSDINEFAQMPIIRQLLRFTLRKADKVVAVCEALKEVIVSLGISPDKVVVIPNGVDIDKFRQISKREARQRLGLPLSQKVILSIGSLIPRKGFDLLIKALQLLRDEFSENNTCLVILGDGRAQSDLSELVKSLRLHKHVRLEGSRPHKELASWYSAADLFCLVSEREGWPNVIMESLACGTPVVATNVWGIPEILCSDGLGMLTVRDERKIAAAIAGALRRDWPIEPMIQFAKAHTWQKTALSIVGLFQTILPH
jgi:glycosyltransferase involved in cell wall biosynthesis